MSIQILEKTDIISQILNLTITISKYYFAFSSQAGENISKLDIVAKKVETEKLFELLLRLLG